MQWTYLLGTYSLYGSIKLENTLFFFSFLARVTLEITWILIIHACWFYIWHMGLTWLKPRTDRNESKWNFDLLKNETPTYTFFVLDQPVFSRIQKKPYLYPYFPFKFRMVNKFESSFVMLTLILLINERKQTHKNV